MYHGKMLASDYRSDWIFGEWDGPAWYHERCQCQPVTTASGEESMRGGHRQRYFSSNGRSRKARQRERRRERRREERLIRRQLLDELI